MASGALAARMARPAILLVGGDPFVVSMLSEHPHHGSRYELESVQYCDGALAVLQARRFDLVLLLSLHVPWRGWPRPHAPTGRIDLTNAILLIKHMRALITPPGNPRLRESARGGGDRGSRPRCVRLHPQTVRPDRI
jgi:hypothetical protein